MVDRSVESVFNPRRLFLFLKRDLVMGYGSLLVTMAAAAGAIFVLSVLSMLFGRNQVFYPSFFGILLYLGGFIFTASVFKELHQSASGSFFLTLPGSTFEKFLSKLLVSAAGYSVGTVVFMTAVSALSELVNRALFGAGHLLFDPFSVDVLMAIAYYLVFQAVFLLGSIWFKKAAFIKTALSVVVLLIGLTIFSSVVLRLVFSDFFQGATVSPQMQESLGRLFGGPGSNGRVAIDMWHNGTVALVAKILLWGCLAPVCWVIAYLRLCEKEV
jgi:hypothetical protein